ncbi:MAG: ATP-binding protein [Oscillospiraceae bacterium]|jgi:hypothetical protein|nr:ATP-binding protein [Oscillospiraceae bacterium]
MSLIKKPHELTVQPTIKTLIYGQPGLGKTTLALSAPNPLLIDFDGGVHRVNAAHQCDTLPVRNYQEFLDVLKEDLSHYKTLVIDTAGKMLDYMGAYLIAGDPKMGKRDGSLALQGYGARKAEFVRVLKQISIMGKHLVFVAHEKEEKDGDQKIIRPEIGGSSAGDLIKELDLVGYMEAIGKRRTISFDPCEKYYAKNVCNLPAIIELPVLVNEAGEIVKPNSQLTAIFEAYQTNLEKRKVIAAEYAELIEMIDVKIESITDINTVNEVSDWAVKFTGWIWDAKLQAGMKLKEKATEIGLTFNRETKKYEPKS